MPKPKQYSWTGPEHYQKAEKAIEKAGGYDELPALILTVGEAIVHALLANAAAIAKAGPNVKGEWLDVLGDD